MLICKFSPFPLNQNFHLFLSMFSLGNLMKYFSDHFYNDDLQILNLSLSPA